MIRLAAVIFGVTLMSTPAWAQSQQQQQKQQKQSQQQEKMQQKQQQQAQSQPSQMTGTVQGIEGQTLTLDVAGQEVKVQGEQQQLQGLQEGQRVQVTAVPFPEAESIEPAQGQPDSKYLLGTVQQKQEDSVTLQTQDQQTRELKVDPQQAQSIQPGQQVIVELKEQQSQASQWKAKSIKPM
jgi:hypothetical protein